MTDLLARGHERDARILRERLRSVARDALWLLDERERRQRGGLVTPEEVDRSTAALERIRAAAEV